MTVTLDLPSTFTVSWVTQSQATTTVRYGASATYGSHVSDLTPVAKHSAILTGAALGSIVHLSAQSQDPNGTVAASGDVWFTASAPSSATDAGGE